MRRPFWMRTGRMAGEDTYSTEDDSTPGEAVLTGSSNFAAQAKLSREQIRSQNKADLQEIINNQGHRR